MFLFYLMYYIFLCTYIILNVSEDYSIRNVYFIHGNVLGKNYVLCPLTPNVQGIQETQKVRKKVGELDSSPVSTLSTLLFFHFYCSYCSLSLMDHDYSVQLAATSFAEAFHGKRKRKGE